MTRTPLQKATVAAILSCILVLATPVMATGTANAESARAETAISFSIAGFFTWLGDQIHEGLAYVTGSDEESERQGETREKVDVQQRACHTPEPIGCKD